MNMRKWLTGLMLLWLSSSLQAAATLPAGIIALKGHAAPELRLADMDGAEMDSRDFRGHWLFVHFWASWCGPCRREIPHIEQLVQRMQGQGMGFMIVNTAEDEDTVFAFLGGVAPGLNSLLDRDGLATEQWQPRGLPATYLVDPDGMVRYQALGGREWNSQPYVDFLQGLIDGQSKETRKP